jgi:hypothetical protein
VCVTDFLRDSWYGGSGWAAAEDTLICGPLSFRKWDGATNVDVAGIDTDAILKTNYLRLPVAVPGAFVNGSVYYDPSANILYLYNGAWRTFRQITNRLASISPTQSSWDTAPTNLANATDGDWNTATGIAINTGVSGYSASAAFFV